MNLAGKQAKQFFKSLRTGSPPPAVGLWAAATVVDQLRKRSRPERELIASKKLKPGQSYVIRVPGEDEGSLAESVKPGTAVATIDASGDEGSITSQLFSAATGLIASAAEVSEESEEPAATAKPSRRRRRRAADEAAEAEASPKLSRRQRRKAARKDTEATPVEKPNGSLASTLVEVAASFMEPGDEEAELQVETPKISRRQRRRTARLASLDAVEFDREALPRRRRRKLDRAERLARKRPGRKRVRKARHQQKRAAKAYAKSERRAQPSRRRRRKIRGAERELEYLQAKVEKRSTRRRRRKLRKAEKAFKKLT